MATQDDRRLGMHVPITRRDFVNGLAIGAGAAAASQWLPAGMADLLAQDAPYPPARTGLRGSHAGSFETLHALRDGQFWTDAGAPTATGEEYDLVIVGGGLSGLTAAVTYREARPDARILILENHDDFGGHARRNEFTVGGRRIIGYGGTQSIDSPAPYSAEARAFVAGLGVDVASYRQALDSRLYSSMGLRGGLFFDRETFGRDQLVLGDVRDAAFREAAPFAPAVKRDLGRLYTEKPDPMPGLTSAEKKARLARMTYLQFLTDLWKLDPGVLWPFQTRTHGLFGVGLDAVPAQDAFGLGLPGFQGMNLAPGAGPGQNHDSIRFPEADDYYYHFPDGNATLARLMVRRLIPQALPGSTVEDSVTARADYSQLDVAGRPCRIRLNSAVLRVRHTGPAGNGQRVEVTYGPAGAGSARGLALSTVTARSVVLACWHAVIPAICPELPAAQREALDYAIKVPLAYSSILIRQWTAFRSLGVQRFTSPRFWHRSVNLDFPVSVGTYRHQTDPAQPIVLHMTRAACQPGLPVREQHRAGRRELLATSFDTIERDVREQLQRVLGAGGFDSARDILGITINRWPHGYAYQYNSLDDEFWLKGTEPPCVRARQPHGRIAIANSDSAAYAYTDAAIDHGRRAAREVLARA